MLKKDIHLMEHNREEYFVIFVYLPISIIPIITLYCLYATTSAGRSLKFSPNEFLQPQVCRCVFRDLCTPCKEGGGGGEEGDINIPLPRQGYFQIRVFCTVHSRDRGGYHFCPILWGKRHSIQGHSLPYFCQSAHEPPHWKNRETKRVFGAQLRENEVMCGKRQWGGKRGLYIDLSNQPSKVSVPFPSFTPHDIFKSLSRIIYYHFHIFVGCLWGLPSSFFMML